ncbi:MAG TPA: zf-HC2 domain-containing protein [Acidisarcina sp.]
MKQVPGIEQKGAECGVIRGHFSSYLDGILSGVTMQQIATHLAKCTACTSDFAQWRTLQHTLGALGTLKPPADLSLRLRVAISQERSRTPRHYLGRLVVLWENSVAPLLLQASAGFAGAVLLLGIVALLAAPEPLSARDEPIGMATGPRFLYSSVETDPNAIGERGRPLVVEAYIDGNGRVYDYQIVSGPRDAGTKAQLENLLIFSVFEPARVFGQPVRGLAVLSFSGVSVQA